jgi:DNA end-binding protein Ku
MAVAHKGAISFGLVHIPVDLYTATQDVGIRFNQLHNKCKSRIRYKKVCPVCNISDLKPEDIVKGYEYEKDKYVIMESEDFENIKTEKDKTITILHFADLKEIDPIFYEKTYYVAPNGSDKAYVLLKTALESEQKVAIGRTVLGTKETMVTIRPAKEGLVIETMYFLEEIKAIPKGYANVEVNPAELDMAKMLINNMTSEFKPELYRDTYTERLKEAIQQKINGEEIVELKEVSRTNVIDLMEALKQSVQATKKAQ